jgi:Transposase DDE domain
MRPQNPTLTAPQVYRCAAAVLQDHLKLRDHGPKCRASVLITLLFYAAARITSLSDACKSLRDAPSDEAARLALIATLPDFAALQRRLNAALAGNLPRALRRRPQRLAGDLVLIPYHGQPLRDPDEIYRSAAKSGTSHFHAYATLYVVRDGYRFTVALTAVARGEPLEEVLKRLLRQAARVGIGCRLLLLDRGFYSVGVIRYLQAARYPFLMPVVCRGRQLDDPRGPSGTNVFLTWQSSGLGTYTLHDARGRPARVSICVKCRYYRGQWHRHGKQRLIYAFWGLQRPSFDWVRETYRQRFAIETTYRQLHQARIRTSTRDPVHRLLYVGIALILRNVWVWLHQMVLARPRRGRREVRLDLLRFRRMLLWLAHVVETALGVRDSVTVELQF